MKKTFLIRFGALALGLMLLTGCGQMFPKAEIPEVEFAERISTTDYKKTLTIAKEPVPVAEPEEADPSLYDPTAFASVNGFSQMKVLIRNDYFRYEPLAKGNFDKVDTITEPTNVDVRYFNKGLPDSNYGMFSCFVYQVDEDYVYLGTAGHCIVNMKKLSRFEVRFFDREVITVDTMDYVINASFKSTTGDYAMYRLPVDAIPKDTLLKLKQVCFDKKIAGGLKPGDEMYTGNIYARNIKKDFDRQFTILDTGEGFIADVIKTWPWIGSKAYYIADKGTMGGQSGSALFDSRGYLVAIVSGHGTWNKHPYGIYTKADKMDEMYQELKKK